MISLSNELYDTPKEYKNNMLLGFDNKDEYPLICPVSESPVFVWVDDDFDSTIPGWNITHFNIIQHGIDAVAENGTVYVYNGTYYENLVINKSIDLIGENKNTTSIVNTIDTEAIHVSADHVIISHFLINNSDSNSVGINFFQTIGGIIKNSTVTHCYGHPGIIAKQSDNTSVVNNTVLFCGAGISISSSEHIIVRGNHLISNANDGLSQSSSTFSTISRNVFVDNTYQGIYMSGGYQNNISYNNFTNNLQGIYILDGCYYTQIHHNIVKQNEYGILLHGIHNNTVYENTIQNNANFGLRSLNDSNTVVVNNKIYHNDFMNNGQNAFDEGINMWDDGYPSGGNYWDDYVGTDSNGDGIGDSPYNISGGRNQDRYPLGIFNLPPTVDFTYSPILPNVNDIVQFTSIVSDPDGTIVNYTWYFEDSVSYEMNLTYQFTDNGIYPVMLEIRDDDGEIAAVAKMVPVDFQMMPISNVLPGWNFMSAPYNHTQDTHEFLFKYDGFYYNWTHATSDLNPTGSSLVNQFLFGWNRTQQTYIFSRNLEPGFGYWMYAYKPCKLWNQYDTIPEDKFITTLQPGWNTISIPFDQAIGKEDILVDAVNWTTAVSNGWVSNFVFGWNRSEQYYDFSNVCVPGEAYWVYAYISCELKWNDSEL